MNTTALTQYQPRKYETIDIPPIIIDPIASIIVDYCEESQWEEWGRLPQYKDEMSKRINQLAYGVFSSAPQVESYQRHFNFRIQHVDMGAKESFLQFFDTYKNTMSGEQRCEVMNTAIHSRNRALYSQCREFFELEFIMERILIRLCKTHQNDFLRFCLDEIPVFSGNEFKTKIINSNISKLLVQLRALFHTAIECGNQTVTDILKEKGLCILNTKSLPSKEYRDCIYSFIEKLKEEEIGQFHPIIIYSFQGYLNIAVEMLDEAMLDLLIRKQIASPLSWKEASYFSNNKEIAIEIPRASDSPLRGAVKTRNEAIIRSILLKLSLLIPNSKQAIITELDRAFDAAVDQRDMHIALQLIDWGKIYDCPFRIYPETIKKVLASPATQETNRILVAYEAARRKAEVK